MKPWLYLSLGFIGIYVLSLYLSEMESASLLNAGSSQSSSLATIQTALDSVDDQASLDTIDKPLPELDEIAAYLKEYSGTEE